MVVIMVCNLFDLFPGTRYFQWGQLSWRNASCYMQVEQDLQLVIGPSVHGFIVVLQYDIMITKTNKQKTVYITA